MRGLKGKRILVAGAATGIGECIARRLTEEGAILYLGDYNLDGVKQVATELHASYGYFNLLDFDSIAEMMKDAVNELGGLDGIVNNAALINSDTMEKDIDLLHMDIKVWQDILNANLIGLAVLSKEALPHLLKNHGGAIVNISSITVHMDGIDEPAYVSSKAGVNALTRHIAAVWGKKGIRANAIAPGTIAHKRFREVMPQEYMDKALAKIPSTRLGKGEDIAAVAAFLLSDDGEFINGQIWAVDGGQTFRE